MRNSFTVTLSEIKASRTASVLHIPDFTKIIYRSNGFEAFVVGETDVAWLIDDNNGIRCKVWKHTTKKSIVKVSKDYQLKRK